MKSSIVIFTCATLF